MPRFKFKRLILIVIIVICLIIILVQIRFMHNNRTKHFLQKYEAFRKASLINKRRWSSNRTYHWQRDFKPWFLTNGTLRPQINVSEFSELAIWPDEIDSDESDRIINQLMYLPPNYESLRKNGVMKTILIYSNRQNGQTKPMKTGRDIFITDNCPVDLCSITNDMKLFHTVDAILFNSMAYGPFHKKSKNQVWIYYLLESPLNSKRLFEMNDQFINMIASYRRDSDIVTPYEKFVSIEDDDENKVNNLR
ncbi:Glycoprotein 3-alpha-L-fucosyltransferase A-like protein [Dinothrombium tinctorium]|uniref:Glycoprotein 3-alpha-L-fucosyltransferase A-like protein n=1 Tax=Dinothrombium tinctorium TaxID=1965070 RepID=A0A443RN06_9ACAR|nr:Glycoprotein 3-alpha-L-fucosyltransferase A-like protein [Dinothrombium tinctorium]